MSDLWNASQIGREGLTWVLTYLLHSTLLLGSAFLWSKMVRSAALRESLWKAALVGGVLTATLQTWGPWQPVTGRLSLASLKAPAASEEKALREAKMSRLRLSFDARGLDEWDLGSLDLGSLSDHLGTEGLPRSGTPLGRMDSLHLRTPIPGPLDRFSTEWEGPRNPRQWETHKGLKAHIAFPQLGEGSPDRQRQTAFDAGLLIIPLASLIAAVLVLGMFRGRRRLYDGLADRRPCRGTLVEMLDGLRRRSGVRRAVRLSVSDQLVSPLALGRSEICLPRRAVVELDAAHQESLLAHELAHLVREDGIWFLLASFFSRILFFQPLNRLAFKRMREEAEYLCDDWAVRQTGRRRSLALCLAEVASWLGPQSRSLPVPAMASSESPFLKRVKRLCGDEMEGGGGRSYGKWAVAALILTGFVGLAPGIDLQPPPTDSKDRLKVVVIVSDEAPAEKPTTPPVKRFRL